MQERPELKELEPKRPQAVQGKSPRPGPLARKPQVQRELDMPTTLTTPTMLTTLMLLLLDKPPLDQPKLPPKKLLPPKEVQRNPLPRQRELLVVKELLEPRELLPRELELVPENDHPR